MSIKEDLLNFLAQCEGIVLDGDTQAPQVPVGRGDSVVGILPDELKRMYILIEQAKKDLAASIEAHLAKRVGVFGVSKEDETIYRNFLLAQSRQKVLSQIFRLGVDEAFPSMQKVSVAIREGWRLVVPRECRDAITIRLFPFLGETHNSPHHPWM